MSLFEGRPEGDRLSCGSQDCFRGLCINVFRLLNYTMAIFEKLDSCLKGIAWRGLSHGIQRALDHWVTGYALKCPPDSSAQE
jgi:hypothetical protein